MIIQPTRDNILIRIDKKSRIKSYVSPDTVFEGDEWKGKKSGFTTGVVLAVGPGTEFLCNIPGKNESEVRSFPVTIKPRDVVILSSHYSDPVIEVDGDTYRICNQHAIIGIIK